ncbi:MAG: NAD(P)/FAD-dependent oxidoreductase [bacterium]|nr:NAD(P)/FAD-dependent oxidoreductase [bacterium]
MTDLMVIGGGPAGVTAALRARELGASVALVERGKMGGTCTNDGCVPTRVLAKAARLLRDAGQFAVYGLDGPVPTLDFARLIQRTQDIVYEVQEKKQLIAHLEAVGVEVYHDVGAARFIDAHTVALAGDPRTVQADSILIAAGGRARRLNFPGAEHTLVHSDVWTLKSVPRRLVIVGSGATGCQLASVMQAFGAQVTLMDVAPRVLPTEDSAVSTAIASAFYLNGIATITGINGIDRIDRLDDGSLQFTYLFEDEPHTLITDAVLLSVGWPSNGDQLNLGAAGVTMQGAYIQVDDHLRTSAPHIYAIGDINGRMMLVQSAHHQARYAVENALLNASRLDERALVPHGGFTDPEYGSIGLTEEAARKRGAVAVVTVPFEGMDRAVIDSHTEGFCKLIADRETRLILGAHVVGEQAVEIVQIVAAAMAGGMVIEKLADLEFAYPTFSAVIGVAARQLARELGAIPVLPRWSEIAQERPAEWERRD